MLIRGIARDVVDAHIHWGQKMALESQLERFPNVKVEAWTFWFYTMVAHRQAALISLARVFDQEQSSLHMRSWLEAIREHLHMFNKESALQRRPGDPFVQWMKPDAAKPDPIQLEQDINACSLKDSDINALIVYRNILLAHRGGTVTRRDNASEIATLSEEQVKRLLDRAHMLLNRYSYMFDTSIYGTKPSGNDQVHLVFEAMQRDFDRQKSEIQPE